MARPTPDATMGQYTIYINGVLSLSQVGYVPLTTTTRNYIGKSGYDHNYLYTGNMDSFAIFPSALGAADAAIVFGLLETKVSHK
jgi:hypothetical protein